MTEHARKLTGANNGCDVVGVVAVVGLGSRGVRRTLGSWWIES